MAEKQRFLILTADSGFGHRSAANALATALEQSGGAPREVVILNPIADRRAPFFLRESAADYDRVVRKAPELYRLGYDLSEHEIPTLLIERVVTLGLYEILRDMVRTWEPDAIILTYPLYQAPLAAFCTIHQAAIPLVTVVTDLAAVHRIWFSPEVQLCLVPTEKVHQLALNHGLLPDRVCITGVPVSPRFAQGSRARPENRAALGWDPDLPVFLAVGSRRVARLLDMLDVLNHFGAPLQVAVVAGKDADLLARLRGFDWHVPVHIYDFVDNMPELMLASDAVICKAGGLIVTEALAAGLPVLLIDVIPGQEEGNRDYVLENRVGALATNPMEMLHTLAHWMSADGAVLREYTHRAETIGRPASAQAAAALVEKLVQQGPAKPASGSSNRAWLIELLRLNNILW